MINLKQGLHNLRKDLLDNGYEIETERWQGGTDHPGFLEILHADMQAQMYDNQSTASEELIYISKNVLAVSHLIHHHHIACG